MAFKASSTGAEKAYNGTKNQLAATKSYLLTQRAEMVKATCSAAIPRTVLSHLVTVIATLDVLAAVPGVGQYAKDQENDQNYDVAAEYQATRAAIINCRDALIPLFPTSGGFLLYETLDVNGVFAPRTLTAAQLAGVVTLVDSVIATIL